MRLITLLILLLTWCGRSTAQEMVPQLSTPAKDTAAYTRDTTLPHFEILLTDSSTVFSSADIKPGNPVALFYFSPGCGHCRRAVEDLRKDMKSIREVHFYFLTNTRNMADIKGFYKEHHLDRYKNIKVVGCDRDYFFLSHYNPRWTPELALYDSDLKFVEILRPDGVTISAENIYNNLYKREENK